MYVNKHFPLRFKIKISNSNQTVVSTNEKLSHLLCLPANTSQQRWELSSGIQNRIADSSLEKIWIQVRSLSNFFYKPVQHILWDSKLVIIIDEYHELRVHKFIYIMQVIITAVSSWANDNFQQL